MNSNSSVTKTVETNDEFHQAIVQVAVAWRAFDFAADKHKGDSETVDLQRRAATYKTLLAALIDEMVATEFNGHRSPDRVRANPRTLAGADGGLGFGVPG